MIRSTPRHFKKQRISRNCSLRLSQLSLPSTEFTSLYLINSEIKSLHVIIIPFILFVNPLKYKNLNFFFVFAILSVVDHSTLPNCVMVALRFLVPSVWVRILVRQPNENCKRLMDVCSFFVGVGCLRSGRCGAVLALRCERCPG